MAGPSILAILVAHGSATRLGDVLAALKEQSRPVRLVVAALGDVRLPDTGPPVDRVVELPAGTAFGHAVNHAVEAAGGDEPYLLIVQDDAAPAPDVAELLLERASASSDVAAVGAKLVSWDDPQLLQEVGGSIDRFAVRRTGLDAEEVDHGQHDGTADVLFCSAACLLLRRDAFREAGGFDPAMWPLYEDVDLGWRLRSVGARVVVEPRARVRHAAAMSSGTRRAAGPEFGTVALRVHAERGRLRFMLKNYRPLSLALIVPQYLLVALGTVVFGLARREFWRIRVLLTAWLRIARDLPAVLDARRSLPEGSVDDRELLQLASRRALAERRYERVATVAGVMESFERLEERIRVSLRDPVVWTGILALVVLVLALRSFIFAGTFTLGELRPFPRLGGALSAYLARLRPEGFDLATPAGPGLVVLGALRSLVGGSAALAQKLVLLLPLIAAGFGAVRLGWVLGIGGRGRRWVALLGMVNPVTLVLLREGAVGGLVIWSASMWAAASLLVPPPEDEDGRERWRRRSRWALGWGLVGALHPPGVVWLAVLGLAATVARTGDGGTRHRLRLIGIGFGGAVALSLPWSLTWFTLRSPLIGRAPGTVVADPGGFAGAVLGGGWPWALWTGIALAAVYLVGLTRTTVALIGLAGFVWLGGTVGFVPRSSALAAAGWCTLALLAFVTRRVSDELPTYALGARHAAVIGTAVVVGVAWAGGALAGVQAGAPARTVPVVLAEQQATGRVLWVAEAGPGLSTWATDGFTEELTAFPTGDGPEARLVAQALRAAREARTHRLGGILALTNVSHVVALDRTANRGLEGQADLSPQEEQAGAVVYRNDAWAGPAILMADEPSDPLSPQGLADVVREMGGIEASVSDDRLAVTVPEDAVGVVYLAVGARSGWSVGAVDGTPAAAGVWVPAGRLEGRTVASPPLGWTRLLYPVQAMLLLTLVVLWLGAVYLTGPEAVRRRHGAALDLRPPGLPRPALVLPALGLVAAAWVGWGAPVARAAEPFLSAAWYCPPAGENFQQRIAVANPGRSRVPYAIRTHLAAAPTESGVLSGRGRATFEADPEEGTVVETYGRRVVVASEVTRGDNTDASLCAQAASATNLFPEGGRFALRAVPRLFEAYVLYNPYPDLARAAVRFISPDETIAPPALADLRIEPGGYRVITPEAEFEPMLDLSAEVTVWQGRAIVARRLRTEEDLSWSMPTEPVSAGVLPRAATRGATTMLMAVNPGDRPVQISLLMLGEEGTLPRQTFEVDARSRVSFDLGDVAPDLPGMIARVTAARPLAIESLVVPDDRAAVSVMPPLRPASRWALPIGEDRALLVANPGNTAVRVEIERLGPGGAIRPMTVGPGQMEAVALQGSQPFGLLLRVRGGAVTAAVVGPKGTVPGLPLD